MHQNWESLKGKSSLFHCLHFTGAVDCLRPIISSKQKVLSKSADSSGGKAPSKPQFNWLLFDAGAQILVHL